MMKNNVLIIFLVLAVCFIWGSLILKIYKQLRPGKNTVSVIKAKSELKDSLHVPFRLRTVHDPFIKSQVETITDQVIEIPNFYKQQDITDIVLPQYVGLIQNANYKTAIFLSNKKTIFRHTRGTIRCAKITSITHDSVIIRYKGKDLFIHIGKNIKR